jgi:hypothetical protein
MRPAESTESQRAALRTALTHGATHGRVYHLDLVGFQAAIVDLTNPDARRWLKEIIAAQVRAGRALPAAL